HSLPDRWARASLELRGTGSMPLTFRQGLGRRWMWSSGISLVICALWFCYRMMRERCWMYQPYGLLTTFLILWLLLFLFLAFRIKGRVILLGLVLLVAIFWANVQRSEVPAAKSGAVGRLRQLNAAMEDYKSQHQSYPERLPDVSSRWVSDKYYRFDLVSSRSAD